MLRWLKDIEPNSFNLVGGKAASLSKLIQSGVNVPDGFVVTTKAYDEFLRHNKLEPPFSREVLEKGVLPEPIKHDLFQFYDQLCTGQDVDVAVRSSSTAEDLENASFAGQQDTYLNVKGKEEVADAVIRCFASLFNERAINYRKQMNVSESFAIMAVCVQKMVRSDLGASGVAFSLDPDTGFNGVVVINGALGLGEMVVQGTTIPDEFIVHKSPFSMVHKKLGQKYAKLVYDNCKGSGVCAVATTNREFSQFCLNDEIALQLAKMVMLIEKQNSSSVDQRLNLSSQVDQRLNLPSQVDQRLNLPSQVDVEWAYDGKEMYIVQARPETVHSKEGMVLEEYKFVTTPPDHKEILSGIAVGEKISEGKVKVVRDFADNAHFQKSDVLVTEMTDPDWEPLMVKASAVVTEKGGRTCHASIIARELGINAIVGAENATSILQENQRVTVSSAQGNIGKVYQGYIPYVLQKTNLASIPETKTAIMLNIANPSEAYKYTKYPASGVGLVRLEFIINNYVKVHPQALLDYHNLPMNSLLKKQVSEIIGSADPSEYFVETLTFGLARICSAFFPRQVIIRFSDFKTNEYRKLLGGKDYEPEESNPMLGWRGAARYCSSAFCQAFGLECKVIKRLRDDMGFTNITVMIPFCRTPAECVGVQNVMKEYGLERKKNGLQVYIMCETPSNVLLADEFCQLVDGFSIGSNDLTQLTLGVDRDSSLVSHVYDERDPSVKKMIKMAIQACKKNGVKIGICGKGPTDFPEFTKFLVEQGIESISVPPSAFFKMAQIIASIDL